MDDIILTINGIEVTGMTASEGQGFQKNNIHCFMQLTLPDDSPWVEKLGTTKLRCKNHWGHDGPHEFRAPGHVGPTTFTLSFTE